MATKTFEITDNSYVPPLSFTAILTQTSFLFDGMEKRPLVIVMDGNVVLTEGVDYYVNYFNNTNCGTATVIINGMGNYDGSVTKHFTIYMPENTAPPSYFPSTYNYGYIPFISTYPIKKSEFVFNMSSVVYDGFEKELQLKVYNSNGKLLIEGVDYVVSYENNIDEGKATIIIKGIGDGNITYTSSNTKICTVSKDGKVTVKGIGKVTITISASGTDNYKPYTKKMTIIIHPKAPVVTGVTTSSSSVTLKWQKVNKASGYQVQSSSDKNFSDNVKAYSINDKTVTSKTISNANGIKMYYRVRSYTVIDGVKIYSEWSYVVK